jgi:hypothetical protein
MNQKVMGALIGSLIVLASQNAFSDSEIDKGRRLQCHNRDPGLKGSIGPEMTDAPLEVMTSKIMTGKYPEVLPAGFVPKRKTRAMRPIPKLKQDIPAIWKYVQSTKK